MEPRSMTDEERRSLLQELRRLGSGTDEHQDIRRVFLPLPVYNLALRPETMIIRGARGAGKTALFHCLGQFREHPESLQQLFPGARLPEAVWLTGFSESTAEHPSSHTLDLFASQHPEDGALRLFWTTHLLLTLAAALPTVGESALPAELWTAWQSARSEPARWALPAQAHLGTFTTWLDRFDKRLETEGRTVFVTYDHLDRLGLSSPRARERYAATLLTLWISLSRRYQHLRPKIFLREDLFEACQRVLPDASGLKSRSVSLDWDVESLYRLLIRHMAGLGEDMRNWLTRGRHGVELLQHPLLGWMPPGALPAQGYPSQKALMGHLAGERIGSGVRKAYTYRWLPNQLQDARGRVLPRSLLTLIRTAAEEALKHSLRAEYDHLLHPQDLSAALEATSRDRVQELLEEHKVVARLEHLRGQVLFLERKDSLRLLAQPPEAEDGFGDDGEAVLEELVRIGVVSIRLDGRLDVPDIYRYAFGIERKGGAARPQ